MIAAKIYSAYKKVFTPFNVFCFFCIYKWNRGLYTKKQTLGKVVH